jgi:hypothetical protein
MLSFANEHFNLHENEEHQLHERISMIVLRLFLPPPPLPPSGHSLLVFGGSAYVTQLADHYDVRRTPLLCSAQHLTPAMFLQLQIPTCALDSPRIITPDRPLVVPESAIFPHPSPTLNFSGCSFHAPLPPAFTLAPISRSSTTKSVDETAAAALQTPENARVAFIADAGACCDALTLTSDDSDAASERPTSNSAFCSRLISWSMHLHARMTATITLAPEQVVAGSSFEIRVILSGSADAISAASSSGLSGGTPVLLFFSFAPHHLPYFSSDCACWRFSPAVPASADRHGSFLCTLRFVSSAVFCDG